MNKWAWVLGAAFIPGMAAAAAAPSPCLRPAGGLLHRQLPSAGEAPQRLRASSLPRIVSSVRKVGSGGTGKMEPGLSGLPGPGVTS